MDLDRIVIAMHKFIVFHIAALTAGVRRSTPRRRSVIAATSFGVWASHDLKIDSSGVVVKITLEIDAEL